MLTSLKKYFGAQDMTVGSPTKCLLKFTIPMLLGNIAQLLYSTVDTIVVGNYCGDEAIAAIGTTGPMVNLFMIFFMAIGTGVTVMVAQYYGAKQMDNLAHAIGNSLTMILCATVIITAVGAPLAAQLLRLIKVPQEVLDAGAEDYLRIILLGSAGNGFYNIISGILRGLGEAIFPLLALIVATLLNIVLDIWFVSSGMDAGGAALATIIAQAVSAVMCLLKLLHMKDLVTIHARYLRPSKKMVGQIIRLGIPAGITQGIMSLSFAFVQSIINGMGQLVMTATTAIMRVDAFVIMPSQTFTMTASTYAGQNIGAGRLDRVRQGIKIMMVMIMVIAGILDLAIVLFGTELMRMFTQTPAVLELGQQMFYIMAPAYIVLAIAQILSGVIRGAGDTMSMMWITICTNVVIRVPLAYFWAKLTVSETWPGGHPAAIYGSMLVAMTLSMIATFIYYRTGRWKTKSIIKRDEPVVDFM